MTQTLTRLPQLGQWRNLEELTALQHGQLPQTLEWAACSPFYRARLASSTANGASALGASALGASALGASVLAALPVTTKQDLRDNYPFGMLAVAREQLATYHESSGTSGVPTPSYYTAEDWIDLTERYARKWVGIHPGDTFLVRTPYAMMITGHLAHSAARHGGATVVPGDNRSLAMPYSRVVRVLHDLQVTLTWSMPTETLLWAAAARMVGYRPRADFPALRALFVGGEPLTPARRRRISDIWGVPVVEEYGSTETGSLAGECRFGRMHLWADRAIFEVYDPISGESTPDGAGQLVVTPLYRSAMPLLRYNLEDNVAVSYDECECGWQLPTVRVLGRSAFGYPVGRTKVTQHQLEQLVFELPAEYDVMFWRAKAQPQVLRVEIEVPEAHRSLAGPALSASIRTTFQVPCEVTCVAPGSLVPQRVLTDVQDVVKPRSLFGADEDWGRALLYY
jgi:phenylacetate-CoA ligase